MKINAKPIVCVVIIFSFLFISNTSHAATTDDRVVEIIQISENETAYFRPVGLVRWGGEGCPGAIYAYFRRSQTPAYDSYLSLGMASKLNGTPVRFIGTCSADGRYLLVTYMFLL